MCLFGAVVATHASERYPHLDIQSGSHSLQTQQEFNRKINIDFDLTVTPITISGAENRITIAIIGDGYTADELVSRYQPMVESSLNYFLVDIKLLHI